MAAPERFPLFECQVTVQHVTSYKLHLRKVWLLVPFTSPLSINMSVFSLGYEYVLAELEIAVRC